MTEEGIHGKVLYNYHSVEEDELTLNVGDEVNILEMYDDGWWLVSIRAKSDKYSNIVGLAPSNYIMLVEKNTNELLPKGWKFSVDTDSNQPYYYNEITGVVQWEKPIEKSKMASSNHPNLKQTNIPTLQTSDLQRLKDLRVQAEEKISALR